MNKRDLILQIFSLVNDKTLSPLQLQKLLFLVDEKLSIDINGTKFFNFEPYDFGPFDRQIYIELNALISTGQIIVHNGKVRQYQLIDDNFNVSIAENIKEKIKILADFVKKCTFKELLTAIYKEYPHTAIKAIYKEWGNK